MDLMGRIKQTQHKIKMTKNHLNTVFDKEKSQDGLLH